ncbi:mucin-4 isoform X2 [Hyalella azteca]|uniref:Mucin-4 isoform X2 n=1 Tax=Hyalella azteca TaxID=294128 RepID=A0A979FVP6_HYAAZ|nr:mucin-4 isoform X2 [Hyalella azteca]
MLKILVAVLGLMSTVLADHPSPSYGPPPSTYGPPPPTYGPPPKATYGPPPKATYGPPPKATYGPPPPSYGPPPKATYGPPPPTYGPPPTSYAPPPIPHGAEILLLQLDEGGGGKGKGGGGGGKGKGGGLFGGGLFGGGKGKGGGGGGYEEYDEGYGGGYESYDHNEGGGKGKGKGFWDFDLMKGIKGMFSKGKGGDDYDYEYELEPILTYGPPPKSYGPPVSYGPPPTSYGPPPPTYGPPPPTYGPPPKSYGPPPATYGPPPKAHPPPPPVLLIPVGGGGGKGKGGGGGGKGKGGGGGGKGKGGGYLDSMMDTIKKAGSAYDKAFKNIMSFGKGKGGGGKGGGKGSGGKKGGTEEIIPIIIYGPPPPPPPVYKQPLPSYGPPVSTYGPPPSLYGPAAPSSSYGVPHGHGGGGFGGGHSGHGPPKPSDIISINGGGGYGSGGHGGDFGGGHGHGFGGGHGHDFGGGFDGGHGKGIGGGHGGGGGSHGGHGKGFGGGHGGGGGFGDIHSSVSELSSGYAPPPTEVYTPPSESYSAPAEIKGSHAGGSFISSSQATGSLHSSAGSLSSQYGAPPQSKTVTTHASSGGQNSIIVDFNRGTAITTGYAPPPPSNEVYTPPQQSSHGLSLQDSYTPPAESYSAPSSGSGNFRFPGSAESDNYVAPSSQHSGSGSFGSSASLAAGQNFKVSAESCENCDVNPWVPMPPVGAAPALSIPSRPLGPSGTYREHIPPTAEPQQTYIAPTTGQSIISVDTPSSVYEGPDSNSLNPVRLQPTFTQSFRQHSSDEVLFPAGPAPVSVQSGVSGEVHAPAPIDVLPPSVLHGSAANSIVSQGGISDNDFQGVLSNLPQLPLETESPVTKRGRESKSDDLGIQKLIGTELSKQDQPISQTPEPRKISQSERTLLQQYPAEGSLSNVLSGGFGDIKPVVISADEFAAITGGLTDGVSIRLLGEAPKNFDVQQLQNLISDSNAGVEITSPQQLIHSTRSSVSAAPVVAASPSPAPSPDSFVELPNVHKLEPSFVNKNVQLSQPQLIHSSQGTPNPPQVVSLSQPQVLSVGQPQFLGASQPQIVGFSGGDSQGFFSGENNGLSNLPEIQQLQNFGSGLSQHTFQEQSSGHLQSQGQLQPDLVSNEQIGHQQQLQSLDNHNPSFQSILESVDVRSALKSSKDSTLSQPLPVFTNSHTNDQLLSGSDNIPQSQVQVSLPPPQSSISSSIVNAGGEVGQRGSATVQRGTLLGSTIGEVINPESLFRIKESNDDDSTELPSSQVFRFNSQQFQNVNTQQFQSVNSDQLQNTLRLNNLGQSSFVGASQGNPSQPQTLFVSDPQVVGVSLPQPVSVSQPRLVEPNNQFTVLPHGDISDEDIEPAQLLRLSRSQGSSSSNKNVNSLRSNNRGESKDFLTFEKMLEHSFGPDTEQDLKLKEPAKLLKTPDMSSLPLEKPTDSSPPVFPPFTGSSNKQQSTSIQKAVLKGSSFLGTVTLPARTSQRHRSRAIAESSRLPDDLSTSSSINTESLQSPNKLSVIQPDSVAKASGKRIKSVRVTSSARVEGPSRTAASAGSQEPSVQYTAPGQQVFFNFGSQGSDPQRSTRTVTQNKGSGNNLESQNEKSKSDANENIITRLTTQVTTATDDPTKLPTTVQQLQASFSVETIPTNSTTLKSTTLPITTSRPAIRFDPSEIKSKNNYDDAGDENSTEVVTTTRPIRLRPVVRRPGVRRRRVRPVNKASNFNPRSRGEQKNVKKGLQLDSADPTASTEIATQASTTVSIYERAKLLNTDDIIENSTNEQSTSGSKRLIVKGTRVTSSTTTISPGQIKGTNYASDTDSGIPFGARLNSKKDTIENTNTGN